MFVVFWLFVVLNYRRVTAPVPAFPFLQLHNQPPTHHHNIPEESFPTVFYSERQKWGCSSALLPVERGWDGQEGSEKKKKNKLSLVLRFYPRVCGCAASSWSSSSRFGASVSCLPSWRAFPSYSFAVPEDLWGFQDPTLPHERIWALNQTFLITEKKKKKLKITHCPS